MHSCSSAPTASAGDSLADDQNRARRGRIRFAERCSKRLGGRRPDSRGSPARKRPRANFSFPNSCLGTPGCETLFRVGAGTRNGVSKTCVPKQEFGNERKLTMNADEDKPGTENIEALKALERF